jgi:hypothetical protein
MCSMPDTIKEKEFSDPLHAFFLNFPRINIILWFPSCEPTLTGVVFLLLVSVCTADKLVTFTNNTQVEMECVTNSSSFATDVRLALQISEDMLKNVAVEGKVHNNMNLIPGNIPAYRKQHSRTPTNSCQQ